MTTPEKEKKKSWYEQTLEEEKVLMEQSMEVQSELCKETKSQEVEDPDAERIFEDDDLMDEDELLTED